VAEGQVLPVADVSSERLPAVEEALQGLVRGVISRNAGGLHVEASVAAGDPRDLNRQLLSALRRVERRTRLRAEWTVGETTHRFFDYALQGVRPTSASAPPLQG
jgi:hypothetical protein